MHAQKRKEALHEPQGRAGVHPPEYCYGGRVSPASVGNADGTEPLALARSLARRDACPTLGALRFQGKPDGPSVLIRFFRRTPALFLAAALTLPFAGRGEENPRAGSPPGVLSAASGGTAPDALTVSDIAGQRVDPFAAENAKAIVFIFVGLECPISNRYAPEIRRLDEQFSRVRFWLVYADPDASSYAIEKHLKEYKLPRKVLRDPQHGLVRLGQVRVTPEAAVFLPGRRLVYHGRIDNRYVELGRERPEATQHDLQNVLEAILKGKPVPYATAKAVGCYIPDTK